MKTLPAGLQTHLDSGATTLAWCWRVTRKDAAVYGFTDHDVDIVFDGTIFEASSGFTATDVHHSLGLAVDNLDAAGALSSSAISETDLGAGLWDAATIEIFRVNWSDPSQRVQIMAGSIGEVRRGELSFVAELRGLAHYLNQEQGRTFQFTCDADLGDARCGIDLTSATFKGTGTVSVASQPYFFTATGLSGYADGWFTSGLVTWTGGTNAGRTMEVKRHVLLASGSAELELWRSMPDSVDVSDTFTITAGCDKTFATCKAKFSNVNNFRGFPHIPGNDYVIAIAKEAAFKLYSGKSMFNP